MTRSTTNLETRKVNALEGIEAALNTLAERWGGIRPSTEEEREQAKPVGVPLTTPAKRPGTPLTEPAARPESDDEELAGWHRLSPDYEIDPMTDDPV